MNDIKLAHRNAHMKASEALQDAQVDLSNALERMRVVTEQYIDSHLRLLDTKEEAVNYLSGIAIAAHASWSGGITTHLNITETIMRRAALNALERAIRK